MKELPILFSAPMIRALIEGRKTQTRRVMSPQPPKGWFIESPDEVREPGECAHTPQWLAERCPFGRVGDRLWVRESVRWEGGPYAIFEADNEPCVIDTWPWKRPKLPSIFLPRGASRITLEITEVRVHRLQEISEDDARAEGVTFGEMQDAIINGEPGRVAFFNAHDAFAYLWQSINGERASWSSNPWVWALTVRRVVP